MKSPKKKILLFMSKDTNYFSTDLANFKKIVSVLGQQSPFEVEIIDINKRPDLAEEYKIDAAPTLLIGNRRYIGKPTPEKAIEFLQEEEK